jgi:hypothetical protein
MFASQESTGTGYTTAVTYLVVAFILIPALLVFSRPVGSVSIALAIGGGAVCLAMAWGSWKRSTQSSRNSIAGQKAGAE